jgi:hypothetical protein
MVSLKENVTVREFGIIHLMFWIIVKNVMVIQLENGELVM